MVGAVKDRIFRQCVLQLVLGQDNVLLEDLDRHQLLRDAVAGQQDLPKAALAQHLQHFKFFKMVLFASFSVKIDRVDGLLPGFSFGAAGLASASDCVFCIFTSMRAFIHASASSSCSTRNDLSTKVVSCKRLFL